MDAHTRLIDGVKYLKLHNSNELKKKSLEDNVYFTLRDVFLNYGDMDDIMEVNYLNSLITNNISFEERDKDFTYANKLMDEQYLSRLIKFLQSIKQTGFEFEIPDKYWIKEKKTKEYNDELEWYYDIDMNKYIELNIWMTQFKDLVKQLEIRLEEIKKL